MVRRFITLIIPLFLYFCKVHKYTFKMAYFPILYDKRVKKYAPLNLTPAYTSIRLGDYIAKNYDEKEQKELEKSW